MRKHEESARYFAAQGLLEHCVASASWWGRSKALDVTSKAPAAVLNRLPFFGYEKWEAVRLEAAGAFDCDRVGFTRRDRIQAL